MIVEWARNSDENNRYRYRIRCRNYARYTLHRSCLPIYGIANARSLSFLFLDDL